MEYLITGGIVGALMGLIEIIKVLLPKGSVLTREEAFMLKGIHLQTKEVSHKDIQAASKDIAEELKHISENCHKTSIILDRIDARQNGKP